ncbi:acyl-CoA dehydrogenase family protein [Prauserella cavernicola]|uniref:Acyl-CoA dehydrogenase family protein n=1 Tax=Prauserella cavernicola TaxID=2800127 RepID=A0A934QMV3_9PSEU|nr:acyl-CoA dehydrogenase family protein [Prauserella cavernicola]MBK1783501.1 acyl-CoA dehydrogenase family protein [Prauserella cavernicola]
MDFTVPDEAKETAQAVVSFVERYVEPIEREYADLLQDERKRFDERGFLQPEVLKLKKQVRMASAEAGFYTMFGDESLGGGGLGEVALVHIQEELNHAWGPSRPLVHENVVPSVFTNGLSPILRELDPEVRARLVPGIASGEKTLCFGLSEPGAGSDVQRIRTRAVRDGDHWVLNGSKQWITNAPYADYCILFAVTDPEANRERRGGITAFFVDTSSDGFECSSNIPILGHIGSHHGIISIEDLRVPAENVIGTVHKGLSLALLGISKGRLSMSAMCVGLARWSLDKAVDYARQRETFDSVIGDHQAVQIKLAEMAMDIYAAKSVVGRTAALVESKQRAIKETSITKAFCTEMLGRVADSAMQVHGAMGLSNELRLQEVWRHARTLRIPDGTSEIQRRTIAGRLLSGDTDL